MKIRIAVAVARDGSWKPGAGVRELEWWQSGMRSEYGENSHVVFVEADVPLPLESVVVEGEVAE